MQAGALTRLMTAAAATPVATAAGAGAAAAEAVMQQGEARERAARASQEDLGALLQAREAAELGWLAQQLEEQQLLLWRETSCEGGRGAPQQDMPFSDPSFSRR